MNRLMDDIQSTAHNFTVNFQQFSGMPLDYSLKSLEGVDEMLDGMGKKIEELKRNVLFDLCSMTGCYIFEVARRNYGGEYFWIEEERQPILVAGRPDFSVEIKAWEKTWGRLVNGKEDNIPFYIAGYQEHIAVGKTKKGYHVTVV